MSDSSSGSEEYSPGSHQDVLGTKRPWLWMISFLSSLEEGMDYDEAWVFAETAAWVEETDPTDSGIDE